MIIMHCNTAARPKTAPPISAPSPVSFFKIATPAPTATPITIVIKMNNDTRRKSVSNATTNACRSREDVPFPSGVSRNEGKTRSNMSVESTSEVGRA